MSILRFLTAGESHGPTLTAILEGMVAGVPVTADAINRELARRQVAYGAGGRMKIERDAVRITAGVVAGRTTGAPIGLEVANLEELSRTRTTEFLLILVPMKIRGGTASPIRPLAVA